MKRNCGLSTISFSTMPSFSGLFHDYTQRSGCSLLKPSCPYSRQEAEVRIEGHMGPSNNFCLYLTDQTHSLGWKIVVFQPGALQSKLKGDSVAMKGEGENGCCIGS